MEWIKLTSYYRLYSHEKFRSTIAGLQTEIGDFFYRLMFGELIVSARRQQTVAWLRYRISKRVSIRVTIINNDYCSPACSHTALTFILNSSAGPRRERERERKGNIYILQSIKYQRQPDDLLRLAGQAGTSNVSKFFLFFKII